MGVKPCMWGPIQWTFLHILSFNYPDNPTDTDKLNMKNYLMSLGNVLPCEECRTHFFENAGKEINGQTLDIALQSKRTFSRWMYDLHNLVNVQTGSTKKISFEEVQQIYEPLISTESCNPNSCSADSTDVYCKVEFLKKNRMAIEYKDIIIVVLVIIVVGLGIMFFIKNKNVGKRK